MVHMKNRELLPELTKEQVQNLIKYLELNYSEEGIDYDNYCCAEDGIADGHNIALNTLRKAYEIDE